VQDLTVALSDFESQYDSHLLNVRGLSGSTRSLHRHVVHRIFALRFPAGRITWNELRFHDFVQFLTQEFARLHSRETQRAWLTILRSLLRYLADEGCLPRGWDAALPSIANRQHANLPRGLSQEQVRALWTASEGSKPRNLRDRALLLLFLRLGLRTEEVVSLIPSDIDGKSGTLKIRSAKTCRDRILPLPRDVGKALIAYLRTRRTPLARIFDPTRKPPVTECRYQYYVRNCMRYLFECADITDRGVHSLRHTAATKMIRQGASFKDVADVLGHKSITTTLIYAKLDMTALAQVALPWPGGAR
jgi:site-specific recombinase XerD